LEIIKSADGGSRILMP